MPSLRQPVGPLPASIYWRRRLVVLAAVAVVAALVLWLTTGQDGGSKQGKVAQPVPASSGASAPGSITPGPTPTGPAISTRPGGTGGGTSGGGTSGGATPTGAPATGTGDGGATSQPSGGGTGGGTSGGGTGGGNGTPPVNTVEVMTLPLCTASQLTLELAGTQNAYQPKEKPTFDLKIRNASTTGCRVDVSAAASAVTVNSASGERIWSSADCVTDKTGRWVQIAPAAALTETFVWDRTRSKPQCATPADASAAPAGNYLVQAELTGPSGGPVPARTSTRLDS